MPRPKKIVDASKPPESTVDCNITINIEDVPVSEPKKRGRKPKGGKLIVKDSIVEQAASTPANIILHLKCSLHDMGLIESAMPSKMTNPLEYDAAAPPSIVAYESNTRFARFAVDEHNPVDDIKAAYNDENVDSNHLCSKCNSSINDEYDPIRKVEVTENVNMKDLNDKLKRLKVNLYRNTMDEKHSACFWCTYDYDNQSCFIPKSENDGKFYGYGSFCRPECAVGYLMKEPLDDSTKFERYHLLNRVYGQAYGYTNNIKPAPDPHYMLDKFYGNLSIQEYRKLLNSERMLLVIESPLTRILPELHEDTDDFIAGVYGGDKGSATQAGGVYKVKRQSEKLPGMSKATIMKERFGFTA
jgi:hypothetical protein